MLSHTPTQPLGLIKAVSEGIPYARAEQLRHKLDLTQAEMAALLDISTRTLQRQSDDAHLPTHAAELVLRLEDLWAQATETLETPRNVQLWLRSPLDALQGTTPLSLLHTVTGVEACTQVLGRMAYGVY